MDLCIICRRSEVTFYLLGAQLEASRATVDYQCDAQRFPSPQPFTDRLQQATQRRSFVSVTHGGRFEVGAVFQGAGRLDSTGDDG